MPPPDNGFARELKGLDPLHMSSRKEETLSPPPLIGGGGCRWEESLQNKSQHLCAVDVENHGRT